jgi:predicted class III extradiol MEMO1 family dioxygenase
MLSHQCLEHPVTGMKIFLWNTPIGSMEVNDFRQRVVGQYFKQTWLRFVVTGKSALESW